MGTSGNRTLIESWNGTTWSIVASPNNGTGFNALYDVSCVSASSCNAVGEYSSGNVERTLTEAWDGTAWTLVASPNNGANNDNVLYGVSCLAATSCKTAGNFNNGFVFRTLIESYG
ncbi:MAG: hypothetical protein E6J45_12580 [Chloroflexi bacterium]|nr:MAG: hypothetical protein E6J45_12580 [Chloroflexota bacterium]